jgi:hypothetical protein
MSNLITATSRGLGERQGRTMNTSDIEENKSIYHKRLSGIFQNKKKKRWQRLPTKNSRQKIIKPPSTEGQK